MHAVIDTPTQRDAMKPWDARQQALEVLAVTDETPGVKTFTFRADASTWFGYQPGQFITLEVPTPDGPLMRTYTLSSSPSRPYAIAVTAKAQAGSLGTQWLFDHLKPGSRIQAHGPFGDFTHRKHAAAKYLFVSAGSGITPMVSMLRWMQDCAPGSDVVFVHCARQPEDLLFRRELEWMASRMPRVSLRFVVEQRSALDGWAGLLGRIDALPLPQLTPDFQQREVFCCGPEPFMRTVRGLLEAARFDLAHYHQESFGAPVVEPVPEQGRAASPAAEVASVAVQALAVQFCSSKVEGQCQPGKTVLQTARASGVRIAAACESGICGTCRVRKISGEVVMQHNGGILDEEIDQGYILACCSKPTTALEIEA